jgi:hypothetical protein
MFRSNQWKAMLLAGLLATSAAASPPSRFNATAEVQVRADGSAELIQVFDLAGLDPSPEVQAPIKSKLAQRIAKWSFEPARRDGVAVDGRTYLSIAMEAVPQPEGHYLVRVLSARPGPHMNVMKPPRYPRMAVEQRVEALIVLVLHMGADGTTQDVAVERIVAPACKRAQANWLVAPAKEAAKQWTISNETVAGQALPTRVRVPVSFCMTPQWCRRTHEPGLEPDKPVALDPAVRLLTDVRDQSG